MDSTKQRDHVTKAFTIEPFDDQRPVQDPSVQAAWATCNKLQLCRCRDEQCRIENSELMWIEVQDPRTRIDDQSQAFD